MGNIKIKTEIRKGKKRSLNREEVKFYKGFAEKHGGHIKLGKTAERNIGKFSSQKAANRNRWREVNRDRRNYVAQKIDKGIVKSVLEKGEWKEERKDLSKKRIDKLKFNQGDFLKKLSDFEKQSLTSRKGGYYTFHPDTDYVSKYGVSTFAHSSKMRLDGKRYTKYTMRSVDEQIKRMSDIDKHREELKSFKPKGSDMHRQLFLSFRNRLSLKTQAAIRLSMLHSQMQFLDEIRSGKLVNWRNLTGNAYTGLVTMVYLRFSSEEEKRMRSLAQHEGKRRKATRTKLSPGRHRIKRTTERYVGHATKGVFHGMRYDSVQGKGGEARWFSITDHGQFAPTKATYAYDEARAILNNASNNRPKARGNHAYFRLASGAEYLPLIAPQFMNAASNLMCSIVKKNVGQYLKQSKGK